MKIINLLVMSVFWLLPISEMMAQTDLQVEKIFDTYGKQKGAVLIELSTDVLEGNTRMNYYKSLIIPSDNLAIAATMAAIQSDIAGGSKLIESLKDGKTETGYYCLKRKSNSKLYEYILYKEKSKKMTLIYIQGDFLPQDLEKELGKLKELFIYVNNKRIKLQ